jgi:hypothetical protein
MHFPSSPTRSSLERQRRTDTRESSAHHIHTPSPHSQIRTKDSQPAPRASHQMDACRAPPHPIQPTQLTLANKYNKQHRISEVKAYFGSSSASDTPAAAMGGRKWEEVQAWPLPGHHLAVARHPTPTDSDCLFSNRQLFFRGSGSRARTR